TMIYLLMRKKVDEADLDEIYLEEEEPEAPLPGPKTEGTAAASLNVLPPPVTPAAPPVSGTATIPFTPPSTMTTPPNPTVPKPAHETVPDQPKPKSDGSGEKPPLT